MLYPSITTTLTLALLAFPLTLTTAFPSDSTKPNQPVPSTHNSNSNTNLTLPLFVELEELSRIVDISYCVGTTGISKPFACASRCADFPNFELVDTFNTGLLMSDSCGYIVLDHGVARLGRGRIIVVFRGTYSIANTIIDLSTVPQEYVPYPESPDDSSEPHVGPGVGGDGEGRKHGFSWRDLLPGRRGGGRVVKEEEVFVKGKGGGKHEIKCSNCTVHTGFWTSWQNTRSFILPCINLLHEQYPEYRLDLVGHSLGGAVAALAALEFNSLGLQPYVTTFGEPKVGNAGLRDYIDATFNLPSGHDGHERRVQSGRYRRVTHVGDPVPLLPLQEWGYRAHAGEHFISKPELQPTIDDIRLCYGDEDIECLASAEVEESWFKHGDVVEAVASYNDLGVGLDGSEGAGIEKRWGIPFPARYKMWQLFFAHRDYFWRLGLCVPGGDPMDWGRDKYKFGNGDEGEGVEREGREEL